MEEVSAAPLRANWLNSTSSCTESSDASDLRKTAWLSGSQMARISKYQDSTCEAFTSEKCRDFLATKSIHSTGGARAITEEGDKSSQASTIGVSGISEDSEIGTLLSGGEAALTGSDYDHQKTETSIVSEAVPDASKNEEQEETVQVAHPTLLGHAALRSNEKQSTSTFSSSNINHHQEERDQKNRSTPLKWSTVYRVERTTTNNLEGEQQAFLEGTATPPHDRVTGSQVPKKNVPCYSRLFLLGVFISSGTLTREKTKQRLQPPPASYVRLDGIKEVLRDTKQAGRGVVSEFRKTLRRKSRPQDVANFGSFLADRCLPEARQKARDVVTSRNISYVSCLARMMRGGTHVDHCYEIGLNQKNNCGTQYATTVLPLTLDACLGSRSWFTSHYGGVWTKPCLQTGTPRGGTSPPHLGTNRENGPLCSEQGDQSKSRGYNGKWKCPLMPSGVDPRTR